MIKSFRHKGLRELFETGRSKRVEGDLRKRLVIQLDQLNQAAQPNDMDLPGYVLHPLKWHKPVRWAVTVRQNWRLTFRFEDGDAVDVDLEDYH